MDCCCSCWRPCLYNKPNNKTGDSNWSRVPCMLSWVMIQERVLINPIKVDSSVYSLVARYNIFSYLVLVVEWIGKISYLFNVLHSSGWTNTGVVEWSSMPLGNIAGHDWGRSEGSALRSELLCQSPFRHLTIYVSGFYLVCCQGVEDFSEVVLLTHLATDKMRVPEWRTN